MAEKKEKKVWWKTCDRILESKEEKIPNEQWQELYDLAKGFQQFADSLWLARTHNASEKWVKKFLAGMVARAEKHLGRWKRIAYVSGKGSPEWKKAIAIIWDGTKGTNILYRWEHLKALLPEDHHCFAECVKQIKRIRAERRRKYKTK